MRTIGDRPQIKVVSILVLRDLPLDAIRHSDAHAAAHEGLPDATLEREDLTNLGVGVLLLPVDLPERHRRHTGGPLLCVWVRRGRARRPIAGVTSTRERQASGNRSNASYSREYPGGQTVVVPAEPHQIPIFVRVGSTLDLGDLPRE